MADDFKKNYKLMPIGRAAEILGVSIDTLRRWDKQGIIRSVRPDGKNRYFSLSELESIKFSQSSGNSKMPPDRSAASICSLKTIPPLPPCTK
jgi:DNA (cytosine-5)-methyltransferase 1